MRLFKKEHRHSSVSLNRAEALKCIPVKNTRLTEEVPDTGEVLIVYPVRMRPWIAGLFRKLGGEDRPLTRKLQLDELGTAVWHLMDGRRSVKAIIREFADAYQLHPKEAEVSVTAFIRELGRRGIIGLQM